jgi:hypothetical protein
MTDSLDSARAMVEAALGAAGLSPDPAEVDRLIRSWPRLAAGIESRYTVEGVRYEEPALIFDPQPRFESWY